jgi:hypothetical protein
MPDSLVFGEATIRQRDQLSPWDHAEAPRWENQFDRIVSYAPHAIEIGSGIAGYIAAHSIVGGIVLFAVAQIASLFKTFWTRRRLPPEGKKDAD